MGGGGRIRSGDISLDIRTSDIGGLRQRTFAALATNTKEQAKSQHTPIIVYNGIIRWYSKIILPLLFPHHLPLGLLERHEA